MGFTVRGVRTTLGGDSREGVQVYVRSASGRTRDVRCNCFSLPSQSFAALSTSES